MKSLGVLNYWFEERNNLRCQFGLWHNRISIFHYFMTFHRVNDCFSKNNKFHKDSLKALNKTNKTVKCIVLDDQPMSVIENMEFSWLLDYLYPSYNLQGHKMCFSGLTNSHTRNKKALLHLFSVYILFSERDIIHTFSIHG